ncbi:uncharacterized protein si:ch73-347e22.4 [Siniperca chuatsi]|uniref:uncharacterized protein si:ch73-347e22.4 n=1 Tax=Siniperca chuatsi TaxID=119488 RepID=UPI001CE1C81A|nr:uncharacterized protein si:ch73-347e22.4 [Siniperca chuatsi]
MKRLKLKSAETVPEAIIESEHAAGMSSLVSANEEVSLQTQKKQDWAIQYMEGKTRPPKSIKKARKKRIATSTSKCKRGQRAVQLLSTEDISLQEQNEKGHDKEATNSSTPAVFTNLKLQNPRKHAANTKQCKAEAVNVPVCVPFCDYSAINQCASAELLMRTSDTKTDPAREPVTPTSTKRRNLKTRRQRKRPVQKGTHTITLNVPIKVESDYFDMQCDALEEETVRRNTPDKKHKGKGQRKRKKVEYNASEQTLNPDVNIKSEPPGEVVPNQMDFPLMDIKTELDGSHVTPIKPPTKTRPSRKRKLPRKYMDDAKKPTTLASIGGSGEELPCLGPPGDELINAAGEEISNKAEEDVENLESSVCKSLKQRGRRKKVKPEPDNIFLENLQRNETDEGKKCNKIKQRKVTSTSLGSNDVMVHGVTAQTEDGLISSQIKSLSKKRSTKMVKKEPMVEEAVQRNVTISDEVLTAQDNLDNVSKNKKDKKKRRGKRAKQKLVSVGSGDRFAEAVHIVPNPPFSSLNQNLPEDVKVKSKKRCKRVKPELCAVSSVDSNINVTDVKSEPEDNVSASLGGPSTEKCITTCVKGSRRGSQRLKSKRKPKTSAAVLSENASQIEEVVSDLQNVLTVSFEVDCEAPTADLKWGENMKKNNMVRQTSKKKTLMGLTNLESSEQQHPKCDTRGVVNQEMCDKSKIRCKRRKRKACTRSKSVKMENSCNKPLLGYSSSQDTIFDGMDLNAAKQEHDKSEKSELTSEAASSFQDKIILVESVPSAVPARKSKRTMIRTRRRRNKTGRAARKKFKRPQISAHCSNPADLEICAFSFNSSRCNSISDDEMITLELRDENDDVKQRNTVQTLIDDQAEEMTVKVKHSSKLKNYDPRRHKRKSQKPLECSFCGRSFRHITAFTVHKRIHTGEKPYRCPTCGKRFSQLSQLNVHSKIHTEPHAVCCPCCDEKFKSKDEMILHFHIHMKNIQTSNMTEDTTEGKDANNQQVSDCLDSPVASSHNKPFRCSVCFKEFMNRATFKMHRRMHGGKSDTCSVCGKKFCKSSAGFVKLRELKRHSQMPFSCARCGKTFSSFELFHLHQVFEVCSEKQATAHRKPSGIDGFLVSQSVEGQIVTPVYFKCLICKQLHRHWCQYVLHLQTHTHSKSYTCETCRQQYDQTAEMRSHCIVCCRRSGEERACRSSLTDIWKEPEAPQNQVLEPHLDDQSEPPDDDQTGQMSVLPQVETGEKEVTDMQSSRPSPSSSSLSVNDEFDISALSSDFCPALDQASRQPSRFRLQSLIGRHCGRYSCGHCGKSFNRWNKLWLHQRSHRQTGRPAFSCSQCELEFRFLGSYIDHLWEHAAQTPYACPLCPDTFANEENLTTHISECHKHRDFKKCSTCGKNFSTLRNLKKHKLLHKGASSHFCRPCNVSFSSNSALKTHLKTHKTRLNVPQPAGLVEPLLFPYHCRKCTAKFSSTDLLQAHQICHFTAGKKPESPPESVVSFIHSRAPEDTHGGVSESSWRKRRLPVSNKKHLFRYPHPDRLYVVPVVSSEPPIVISDTEEERQEVQVQSSSITFSASNTVSDFPQRQPGFNSSDPNMPDIPQSSAVATLRDMDEHETGSSKNQRQDHSDKSPILPESHQDQDACKGTNDISGFESDSAELIPLLLFSEDKEIVDDIHTCAICRETFTDISKLHEHYIDHARGL